MQHEGVPRLPRMAVDTGARLTVITPRLARELGLRPDGAEPAVSVTGVFGDGSAVLLRVASVSILGAEVRNLRVLCHPLPSKLKIEGIIGLNFLKHFKIVIDNETEILTLTRWRE
jgi:aspartyl protease family protein